MGIYSDVIFPWACDRAMSSPAQTRLRQVLLRVVQGEVLEIGFGTGLNLPHYPARIQRLTAVDINAGMNRRAHLRVEESSIEVNCRVLNGESLPMGDHVYDSVVSTWTLCSIEGIGRALREIYRVLKPGGRFYFVEHGQSRDPQVRRWQDLLNPLQQIVGVGCHLNRDMRSLIGDAGFRFAALEEFYIEDEPRTHAYTYQGIAVKE